ncbi:hypothetical protein CCACVL1_31054 [Corchorus capsularis]|uniref:Uncharacterized protein n=1 Tax=Corchorus capsularis TaxID=210143 RepID=A0A1R3FU30_COCAP|nr:hypothetical protein CCACVL1_31054 [Corchorus capsularis]
MRQRLNKFNSSDCDETLEIDKIKESRFTFGDSKPQNAKHGRKLEIKSFLQKDSFGKFIVSGKKRSKNKDNQSDKKFTPYMGKRKLDFKVGGGRLGPPSLMAGHDKKRLKLVKDFDPNETHDQDKNM